MVITHYSLGSWMVILDLSVALADHVCLQFSLFIIDVAINNTDRSITVVSLSTITNTFQEDKLLLFT